MPSRKPRTTLIISALALVGLCGGVVAQINRGTRSGAAPPRQALSPAGMSGLPEWENDPHFKSDVFTFVRIQYSGGSNYSWHTDAPDSDDNFSYRLQQMTSLKVKPHGVTLQLTDDELFDYPFIYMLEIRSLRFSQPEVDNLRRYLLNGGFLMVDDHWGDAAYRNIASELRRALPDREPVELQIDHPIFHAVFDLKEKPQVPGIEWASANRGGPYYTSEQGVGPAHYRAIFDDKGRMMVLICSNTDLGDGWEREGELEWYFHDFSEKLAYPMGINIVFYAMTH